MDLSGKIALVTGGTRGIGKAISSALGQAGATVIATATSEKGAQAISTYLQKEGITGAGQVLNVVEPSSIERLMQHVNEAYGAPDILVNNAAITRDNLMMRMSEDEWSNVIETNLSAIYRMSKVCLRGMMKKKWGRIVNISSISGFMGNPGQANYAAAKAGVVGFSKSLACEIASRNITVNVVAPGFVDTDMTDALPEATKNKLVEMIPMKRVAAPEEIANVVLFLTASLSSYITGETIHVNGGMYMH